MRDAGLCQMDSIDQACNLVLGAVTTMHILRTAKNHYM